MSLTEEWSRFRDQLKGFGCFARDDVFHSGIKGIYPFHPYAEYRENSLAEYFELLNLANGQSMKSPPVFKSVSGWDKYTRHRLLSLEESLAYYRRIVSDEELVRELGQGFVPFSANSAHPSQSLDEMFAIDLATGEICLLWCSYADPYNPPEWLISCFRAAACLSDFIRCQRSMLGEFWSGNRLPTTPFRHPA
ncbi:MAG: hypothetical protein HQL59_13445 [Magnetococcales bacterium]|nr:hypothetical protein [Magnetococcales bacterium]